MKKKILSFILAICMMIPCIFALSACNPTDAGGSTTDDSTIDDGSMSKSELATTFKSVAKQSWEKLGAGDPLLATTSQSLLTKFTSINSLNRKDIPNEMTEQTGDEAIGVKAMSATMMAYVYMIGEYYENDNFVVSDKVVTFNLDNIILPNEKTQASACLSLLPKVDKNNNKVIVEMFLTTDTMYTHIYSLVKSYYYFDIDYNFQTNQTMGCYFLNVQNNKTVKNTDYEEFTEMSIDKNGKCLGNVLISNNFKTVCNQTLKNFESEIAQGEFLTGNFCDEFNRYGDRANRAYQNVYESNS